MAKLIHWLILILNAKSLSHDWEGVADEFTLRRRREGHNRRAGAMKRRFGVEFVPGASLC
jgi:hypothetical protein